MRTMLTLALVTIALAACSKKTEGTTSTSTTTSTAAASTMDCSTPRKTIQSQYDAIKAGASADVVKTCFTDRQKDKITADKLSGAKTEIGKMSFDELYANEEPSGDGMKVKMKNGRTLTTLVKDGSTWKADTIWFK